MRGTRHPAQEHQGSDLDGSDGRDVVHRSDCTTVEPTDS